MKRKRLNIDIPSDIHRNVKAEAALRGVTMQKLIINTLADGLRPRHPIGRPPTPMCDKENKGHEQL